MLMTTDPGDLVLDPTCGSGTTAYVAEQWGRRWITIDTSRVPLALARQRLLTATFPYYQLTDETARPVGRLRIQAEAEQPGRGGRRDRATCHAEVDRQQRAASGGGARRPARGRAEHHAGLGAVHRRGNDPAAGRDAGGHDGDRPRSDRNRRQVRRPDARSAPQEPRASAGGEPHGHAQERPAPGQVALPLGRGDPERARKTSRSRSSSAPRTGR